jgi:hypothetical protein
MRRSSRKIERLERLFDCHFLRWSDAVALADALFVACSLHLPAATVESIAREFDTIFAAHGKSREPRPGEATPERDGGTGITAEVT